MTKLNSWNVEHYILKEEEKVFTNSLNIIPNAKHMVLYISEILSVLKKTILLQGFSNKQEEIHFFKEIKPKILSKLIFYNKLYRIETFSPTYSNNLLENYYLKRIEQLSTEFKNHAHKTDFYRYYKSERTDKDMEYFTLGNINFHNGLSSIVFEIDPKFSTYYDYKVARILANENLYDYLQSKIISIQTNYSNTNLQQSDSLVWSESQNALIELIYALHVAGSINYGKGEIRKIALLFQGLFGISLVDIHHAFHRMKARAKSKTSYLDRLKEALEEYMEKEY